jgi:hypothetical protein
MMLEMSFYRGVHKLHLFLRAPCPGRCAQHVRRIRGCDAHPAWIWRIYVTQMLCTKFAYDVRHVAHVSCGRSAHQGMLLLDPSVGPDLVEIKNPNINTILSLMIMQDPNNLLYFQCMLTILALHCLILVFDWIIGKDANSISWRQEWRWWWWNFSERIFLFQFTIWHNLAREMFIQMALSRLVISNQFWC